MKKYDFCARYIALLWLVLMVCSCDFFRSLAGRPTSADIDRIKTERSLQEAREQVVRDSLEQVERNRARLAAYSDSLRNSDIVIMTPERVHSVKADDLLHNYYIMIGSFSSEENADKLVDKVAASGYEAVKMTSVNGRYLVAVNPSDNPEEVYHSINKLKKETFCPADVWIYSKE